MSYISSPEFRHDGTERIGVLLVNSGTPVSLATRDVRRFLRGLLSDPRVVELPRALWLPILYGLILPSRPFLSARKYARIWTAAGLADDDTLQCSCAASSERGARAAHARALLGGARDALQRADGGERARATAQRRRAEDPRRAAVPAVLRREHRARSTIRSTRSCAAGAGFRSCASLPNTMTIRGYIEALRASVEQHWQAHGRTERLLVSFHGIPERYFQRGRSVFLQVSEDRAAARRGTHAAR